MIYLYSGSPGSGKSLAMAQEIYWHVKMHRPVLANFEIDTSRFKDATSFLYVPFEEWKPKTFEDYARWYFRDNPFKEGAITVYWDEAQIMLNSRTWRENQAWIPFFTQHRKLGYNVKLVAQHHEMLDKQVRSIIEYETNFRKVNNVGLFGRIVGLCALGHPVVCGVTRWYGQKMRLESSWMLGRKKFYSLYDTYKVFDSSTI